MNKFIFIVAGVVVSIAEIAYITASIVVGAWMIGHLLCEFGFMTIE